MTTQTPKNFTDSYSQSAEQNKRQREDSIDESNQSEQRKRKEQPYGAASTVKSETTADTSKVSRAKSASHQYSAHYTGQESADQQRVRKPQEMSALDRLKLIQSNFKQQWNGIDCLSCGRPGTSNFVNRKRQITVIESADTENDRQKQLNKIFQRLKELEESNNQTQRSSQSQPMGVFNQQSQTQTSFYNQNNKNTSEFLTFKNIVLEKGITNTISQTKNYHIDNQELLVKFIRFENRMVRATLESHHFSQTESHEWNLLWSSGSLKTYQYEGLNEYQKINKFPSSYEMTRKDRLCYNIVRMQEKYGKSAFDIAPDTYILPEEFGDFYNHYQKLKQHESKKNIWIIKPANSCQGRGIYIIDDINDVNVDETSVISKYITNPLLINGHKFDLRIYVCITSFEPLRVYVHQEGLARFASETYTQKINKQNKYMHLTNYSINKKNDKFIANENCEQDDFGYKWSLGAFCKHLEQVGIDMNLLWSRIYDLIIKTILTSESIIQQAVKKSGCHRTNCYELLGFDVLIDSDLKPWLLEVNISSSMATDAPLDMSIKSTLVVDTFNLIGIKRFDRKKESMNKAKHRMKGLYTKPQTGMQQKRGLASGIQGTSLQQNSQAEQSTVQQVAQMLDRMSQDQADPLIDMMKKANQLRYREYIRETLAEYQRRGNYIRIYPAKGCDQYDALFQGQRGFNKAVYRALFTDEIMKCTFNIPKTVDKPIAPVSNQDKATAYDQYKKQQQEKAETKKQEETQKIKKEKEQRPQSNTQAIRQPELGLEQTQPSEESKSQTQTTDVSSQLEAVGFKDQDRVLITGDDILIEYVDRLMREIQLMQDQDIRHNWRSSIEKFITHYVWHSQDTTQEKIKHGQRQSTPFWVRLQGRLQEMQERRRRLIKYLYKKEGKLSEFEEGFQQSIQKKSSIIKKFSSLQLEDLLRTSTKNVAQEVVSSLIPPQGGLGVLADIQQNESQSVKKPERIGSADQSLQAQKKSASAQRFMGIQGNQIPLPSEETRGSRTQVGQRPLHSAVVNRENRGELREQGNDEQIYKFQ